MQDLPKSWRFTFGRPAGDLLIPVWALPHSHESHQNGEIDDPRKPSVARFPAFSTETDDAGRYVFPQVPPGSLHDLGGGEGFRRLDRTGVNLIVDETSQPRPRTMPRR